MAQLGATTFGRKPRGEPLGDADRPVAAARAADADGEIALSLFLEARELRAQHQRRQVKADKALKAAAPRRLLPCRPGHRSWC